MIWLAYRQHRAEALVGACVIVVIGAWLVYLGLPIHADYDDLRACLPLTADSTNACDAAVAEFLDAHAGNAVTVLLSVAPVLIGAFIGAPLIAREIEAGTIDLAWTQGITRRRWILTKLLAATTISLALTAAVTALARWYGHPLGAVRGRFDLFDVAGVVPYGYTVFALAVGVASGLAFRRTLPAMILTGVAFVAARVAADRWRASIFTPIRRYSPLDPAGASRRLGTGHTADWLLRGGIADAAGVPVDASVVNAGAGELPTRSGHLADLAAQGYQLYVDYQPASRYWALQALELAQFTVPAFVILTIVVVRITRRPA